MDIYPNDDISEVTPHYLRHTFTTNGITSGVSIKNMQMLLGHADTKTLMNTYMHVSFEDKKSSISIMEGVIAPICTEKNDSEGKWDKKIIKYKKVVNV